MATGNNCEISAKTFEVLKKENHDVSFHANWENTTTIFSAHKIVLSKWSKTFREQFNRSNDSTIQINCDPVAFEQFLSFFYESNVTLSMENIENVIQLIKDVNHARLIYVQVF